MKSVRYHSSRFALRPEIDRPPTAEQIAELQILCRYLGQRYTPPRTFRQASGRILDLTAQIDRQPVELPPGRCFGIACPTCNAEPGQPCQRHGRPLKHPHPERRQRYAKQRKRLRRRADAELRWAKSWERQAPPWAKPRSEEVRPKRQS